MERLKSVSDLLVRLLLVRFVSRSTSANAHALPTLFAALFSMGWTRTQRTTGTLGAAPCIELAMRASTGMLRTCTR